MMRLSGARIMMLGVVAGMSAGAAETVERQLTFAPQGHVLTNANVWSPDGEWIVYDTRHGDQFNGQWIEQVNVRTGSVQRLYEAKNGAYCGVATYDPTHARVVFIHGPEFPDDRWTYHFTRRRGAVVDVARPGISWPLDAMNYAPPFAAGALRGGSHVHMFSPDGQRVSFTYEDAVLAQLDENPEAPAHDVNQRTIAVSAPVGPVSVARTHPRSHDGNWFSVVVARTVTSPKPGSDEISKAFEEGWIGREGYVRADGSRQRWALAFQGLVTSKSGETHAEVFVVDLPEDLTQAGDAPLAGTATTRPSPPRGVTQRRVTFTDERKFPGIAATPRHWLRVSPDGSQIAFLMKDEAGVVQVWTVSPNGGAPRQVTRNEFDVASAFTWSQDGKFIAHVMDGSVCVTEIAAGTTRRLTARREGVGAPRPEACVFSPDGRSIAYVRDVTRDGVTHPQIFVVSSL
jgi:hypothetical protein